MLSALAMTGTCTHTQHLIERVHQQSKCIHTMPSEMSTPGGTLEPCQDCKKICWRNFGSIVSQNLSFREIARHRHNVGQVSVDSILIGRRWAAMKKSAMSPQLSYSLLGWSLSENRTLTV